MQLDSAETKMNKTEHEDWLTGWNEENWTAVFQDYSAQSEFTVYSNLRLGSEREAYVKFQGRDLRWINPTPDRTAVLVIPTNSLDAYRGADYNLAQAFLNYASFETGSRASIIGMSSYMRRIAPLLMPAREIPVVWSEERLSSEESALPLKLEFALGLYREGINSLPTSPFLAFLSFYRVLELAILQMYSKPKDGRTALTVWINNTVEHTSAAHHLNLSKTNQVNSGKNNLGEYFYSQCRCAIAHTEHKPIANPNSGEDHMRIGNDMWLMQGLAKFAIDSRAGVLAQT